MTPLVRHNAQGWHFTDPAVLEMRERKAEARRLAWATRRAASVEHARMMRAEMEGWGGH